MKTDKEIDKGIKLVDLERIYEHTTTLSWDVQNLMELLYCISMDVEDGVASESEGYKRIGAVMISGSPPSFPAPLVAGIGGALPVYIPPEPDRAAHYLRCRFGNEFVTELAEAINTESR